MIERERRRWECDVLKLFSAGTYGMESHWDLTPSNSSGISYINSFKRDLSSPVSSLPTPALIQSSDLNHTGIHSYIIRTLSILCSSPGVYSTPVLEQTVLQYWSKQYSSPGAYSNPALEHIHSTPVLEHAVLYSCRIQYSSPGEYSAQVLENTVLRSWRI